MRIADALPAAARAAQGVRASAASRIQRPRPAMNLPILALLLQDGITTGAVYALLALAMVLVFTVTRVIWVPAGELVAFGTLTLAGAEVGGRPARSGCSPAWRSSPAR